MTRTHQHEHSRSGARWALTALALVVASGCAGPESTTAGSTSRVVLAASATANERPVGLTAATREVLESAIASDAGSLDLVVDGPAGPERAGGIDLVLRRGAAVERSAERRRELTAARLDETGAAVAGLAGTSGRIDVLALLDAVARVPGPASAIVATSGLQSVGPLAIASLGWDLVGSDAVLDQAAAAGIIPDLTGKTVLFTGLGDAAGEQAQVPIRLRARLDEMWLGVCRRAGAAECRADSEPAPAGTPASTVAAPVVAIPPDPVLALPTAAAPGPAVTVLPGDVLFRPDSAELLPDAVELLSSVAGRLPPDGQVLLEGRTATVGAADSARAFSLMRAQACRDVLAAAGIPADRIRVAGLGFDHPLVPDVDATGALLPGASRNRSVTMTITIGVRP